MASIAVGLVVAIFRIKSKKIMDLMFYVNARGSELNKHSKRHGRMQHASI